MYAIQAGTASMITCSVSSSSNGAASTTTSGSTFLDGGRTSSAVRSRSHDVASVRFRSVARQRRARALCCGVLRVATFVDDTEAEGPGRRFALWVQGCAIRCAGCCNPEMFAHERGTPMTIADVLARLAAAPGVDGVTLLGGEPFEQAGELAELARTV